MNLKFFYETVVFAGIFGFSVGVFVLIMFVGQAYLEPIIGENMWAYSAVVLFFITVMVRPIERFTYNTAGRLLFRRRRRHQKILKDAAEGMATIKNPDRLLGLIAHIVSRNLKAENVFAFVVDDTGENFELKAVRYPSKASADVNISKKESLISWLKEKRQPLVLGELVHWIKKERLHPKPVIFGSDLERIKQKLISLGASVCIPSFYKEGELQGVLILGKKKSGGLYSYDDLELLHSLADEAAIAIRNSMLYSHLQKKAEQIQAMLNKERRLFIQSAVAFSAAVDARDPYTHGHSKRVADYCQSLAGHMEEARFGDTQKFKQRLLLAALLHDIGKVAIPDKILHKNERLNNEDWMQIKRHPAIGADILNHVKGLKDIVPGVRHHHEHYDGSGYPDRLKQDDIPFMARIMAVADAFDAMTTKRPYHKGLDAEKARSEINNGSTKQFDPDVVRAFMKCAAEGIIDRIREHKSSSKGKD